MKKINCYFVEIYGPSKKMLNKELYDMRMAQAYGIMLDKDFVTLIKFSKGAFVMQDPGKKIKGRERLGTFVFQRLEQAENVHTFLDKQMINHRCGTCELNKKFKPENWED